MFDPSDDLDALATASAYRCPSCGLTVAVVPARDEQIVACPSCRNEFTVPAAPAALDAQEPADDELNGLRIRQLATARRAAYRARSYAIIASVVCLVAAGQFLWHARSSPVRQLALAAISMGIFTYFARLARRFHEEAIRPFTSEPTTPPDFAPLGDGTEGWKRLE